MVDEGRRRSMREYQKRRTAARRNAGLVTRTVWIRREDAEAYFQAVAPLLDHARIIEAVIGSVTVSPVEIVDIIRKHSLAYDPEDIIFLTRLHETLTLKPDDYDKTIDRAKQIITRYGLSITAEDLMRSGLRASDT